MTDKNLKLGAWSLTTDIAREIYPLIPPYKCIEIAKKLTETEKDKKKKGIRITTLNNVTIASCNPIFYYNSKSWYNPNEPWLFATESIADMSRMNILYKSWLSQEFGTDKVQPYLKEIDQIQWQWKKESISLTNPESDQHQNAIYGATPDYFAQEFLRFPEVTLTNGQTLTFYRVVKSEKGAELMSFPPIETGDSTSKKPIWISFVIKFCLQTVPWRKEPLIYHEVSVRKWLNRTLLEGDKNYVPSQGAKVYILNELRWIDNTKQDAVIVPLNMEKNKDLPTFGSAIADILKDRNNYIPSAEEIAQTKLWQTEWLCGDNSDVKMAIAYNQYLGSPPCLPGVSPLDMRDIDQAIRERLPVERVGETKQIDLKISKKKGSKTAPESEKTKEESVIMQRPEVANTATFGGKHPLETILILWKTEKIKSALIAELCRVLKLTATGESSQYQTESGQGTTTIYKDDEGHILRIKTQHVDNLTDDLVLDNQGKNSKEKRKIALEERIEKIKKALPQPEGRSGMLIEINHKDTYKKSCDPYIATRIAPMQLGYVNQRINPPINKEKPKAFESRIKSTVGGLFQQCGILSSEPLINETEDHLSDNTWLTCFYVLRRTKKTTFSGIANIALLMLRVNPVDREVQFTTPELQKKSKFWVSSWEIYQQLLTEKWDYELSIKKQPDDFINLSDSEKNQVDEFVFKTLKDCLNTEIIEGKKPHVLFITEAQNSRKMLKWLLNNKLKSEKLPPVFEQKLSASDIKRLSIVRLRTHTNREVPAQFTLDKNDKVTRTDGLFIWHNVCDRPEKIIYLSLRKNLNTEQNLLKVGDGKESKPESRLDSGEKQAGNKNLLEIVIVHSTLEHDKLAYSVHKLRDKWAYFSGETSLSFPLIIAQKAKEYCIGVEDEDDNPESEEEPEEIDSNYVQLELF